MLNVFNVKTKFQIQYCHNEKLYNFTILNSSNNEILFNSQYSNIIEINKIIQLHKGTIAASNRLNTKGAQVEVLLPKLS